MIVAFTEDHDVQDMDVMLCETDGTLYYQDADSSVVAVLRFALLITRRMKVVFKNYSSYDGKNGNFCRVRIGYK